MKNISLYIILLGLLSFSTIAKAQNFYDVPYPFSTNEDQLTVWNGTEYLPFFLKGVNLGISVPGTFPGELAATRAQYGRWFQEIKDAGFNNIRLYTLHYPRFYQVLDSFNIANPNSPLFFFQGVWLEEELTGYNNDLYMLTNSFETEMQEDIDCVHGNIVIPHRFGKAYGDYSLDVSKWVMGYIIGREVSPQEVITTNTHHQDITSFEGVHFSIQNASPAEVWYTARLNYLLNYEQTHYQTQRPASFSSWPTLDPLRHPEEVHHDEDTVSIDLEKVVVNNAPAGLFVSYHAYPYYPDFISLQSDYQSYSDNFGPNSYLGYLTDLKSHYPGLPLIIAEYGVPSSWGVAHYCSSGMNHGGFDEFNQGSTDIRILQSIKDANCGGGMQFAWIDEWFKRTWVTDPFDYPGSRRILWHNITAAEQNFGLIAFRHESNIQEFKNFGDTSAIQMLKVGSNYDFLEMELSLKNPLDIPDELWVALDTYWDEVGESILPTGDTLPHRSEFALDIKNYSADLYVTESYDLYGIWHHISSPNQMYQTTVTDGAPWYIVRWKNNSYYSSVQYIGALQLNHGSVAPNSKDAVTIYDDKITIRLPWSLINMVAPNELKVVHDDKNTWDYEDTITDGIAFSIKYKDRMYTSSERYIWDTWNKLDVIADTNLKEVFKKSYWVMKDRLTEFNTPAVTVIDSLYLEGPDFPISVSEEEGVLMNDFDMDGDILLALLTEPPLNGNVNLSNDGSFTYMPKTGFNGEDSFKYVIFDGNSLSIENTAYLSISGNASAVNDLNSSNIQQIHIYPNPASDFISISSDLQISSILIFDITGKKIDEIGVHAQDIQLDITSYPKGEYIFVSNIDGQMISRKIMLTR